MKGKEVHAGKGKGGHAVEEGEVHAVKGEEGHAVAEEEEHGEIGQDYIFWRRFNRTATPDAGEGSGLEWSMEWEYEDGSGQ